MVINYRKTVCSFIKTLTTKLVSVDTGNATAIVMTSGATGMEATNNGPATLFYGHSSITQGSGGFLAQYMTKEWFNVVDSFTVYMRADSAQTIVAITEYV